MGTARAGLVGVLLLGCYAAPPPPAFGTELIGCRPGSYGVLSAFECRSDVDCVLCACGEVRSRERLGVTGEACPQPSSCDTQARCCLGRCVATLGPPPL